MQKKGTSGREFGWIDEGMLPDQGKEKKLNQFLVGSAGMAQVCGLNDLLRNSELMMCL